MNQRDTCRPRSVMKKEGRNDDDLLRSSGSARSCLLRPESNEHIAQTTRQLRESIVNNQAIRQARIFMSVD